MRVLVAGWFTFTHGEATAGDLLAASSVCDWLARAGVPHDVARSPAFPDGVRLDEVDPADYSHLLFTCGPAAGWQVEALLARFQCCRRIGVGVSVVDRTPAGFDRLLERDSARTARPDLALGAPRAPLPPVVALVRAHAQPEYAGARHHEVHARIDRLLAQRDVAVQPIDTRVDPRQLTGREPGQVEALLARADAVVTTRLHGLVLALRNGVPAVAVDPVAGGAKVARQAAVLGWPAALTGEQLAGKQLAGEQLAGEQLAGEQLTDQGFLSQLDWCLTPPAAAAARRCAVRAQATLRLLADELLAALPVPRVPAAPAVGPPDGR